MVSTEVKPGMLVPPSTCGEACSCICCGATAWTQRFRALQRCEACGFVRADMDLTPEDMQELYREDYFRGEEYGNYLAEHESHNRNNAYRWRLISRLVPRLAGEGTVPFSAAEKGTVPLPAIRTLFEIGCAYGFWLEYCSRQGVECAGIDVCKEAVAHAVQQLGQRATAEDFLEASVPPGYYEVFCMWDTIEHLAHPEEVVAKIEALLPPGGWLFLSTGDIGSRVARCAARTGV